MSDILVNKPAAVRTAVQDEMAAQAQEWFELQPVEKKLISYSLGLGLGLLVIFIFLFGTIN